MGGASLWGLQTRSGGSRGGEQGSVFMNVHELSLYHSMGRV